MFVPFVKTEFIFYFLISRVKKQKSPSSITMGRKAPRYHPNCAKCAFSEKSVRGLAPRLVADCSESGKRPATPARTNRGLSFEAKNAFSSVIALILYTKRRKNARGLEDFFAFREILKVFVTFLLIFPFPYCIIGTVDNFITRRYKKC